MIHFYCVINGEPCKVTDMFDDFGDPTDDPARAFSIVACTDENHWLRYDDISPSMIYRPN